ncbi:MAG TPA: serine O-acetyltransferase [Campylobacteraceae bacterium]|nr:serine O-acetyltransferase [Campylobacteraceae bacterium]
MKKISLWQLIKEDLQTPWVNDPAIRSRFEIFFNYPGIWTIIHYRVAHALYNRGFHFLSRILMGITQMITNIDIHPRCKIGRRVFIDHGFGVVIGETAEIGDDVLIYQGVTLGGVSLDKDVKRHPTVKNGAVISAGAKVLGNITIGKNAKVGANSVVIKNVPDDSTAVGIPARIIRKGKDQSQLSHNKIPDINKELFIYLSKRIALLEEAISSHHEEIIPKREEELEQIYKEFISSMND